MRHIATAAEWLIELVALAAFTVFLFVACGFYTGIIQ
jgi:hypothetical protein